MTIKYHIALKTAANSGNERIPVIVIFAPTATGKTALAIDLFGHGSRSFFKDRAELISADSMQVYRGMNIGTAKPAPEEIAELPHHLIDIHNIDEQYSVSEFTERADYCCRDIYSRGKIPLIAGGTGFYIRSFLLGLPETPEADEKIRTELKMRIESEGNIQLYKELERIDPVSAGKINVNDSYRIVRALEVYYTTGRPRSSFAVSSTLRSEYKFLILIPERPREILYRRIDSRVDQMFETGLEEEVRKLIADGAAAGDPGMQAIGYREWFTFTDTAEIKENIKKDSRRYAKKQYTYMHGIPESQIIQFSEEKELAQSVSDKISEFLKFDT